MDIFRSPREIPSPPPARAVAIGNFDGLHLGHRRIIDRLEKGAAARGLRAGVLTFSPHPERIFGAGRLLMIQTLEQRLRGLCQWGLPEAVVWPFDRKFAELDGREFAARILVARLNARLVVVGDDFRFGRARACGPADLARFGRGLGFAVLSVSHLKRGGRAVASSRVRSLLQAGRVEEAAVLLARPYALEGDVVAGAGIGRTLGYPTANIQTPNEILPPGIFATLLEVSGRRVPSVSSVGTRPTFGGTEPTVECHLLAGRPDLYGRPVRLHFLRRIRPERRFRDAGALQERIAADAAEARAYFRRRPHL
jgi:riboflavin kinase/FMN adenylyltransferase